MVGAFEMRGSAVLNTALVIRSGQVIGRYAKAHPNEPGVTAGADFPVFQQSAVRYGVNICNDANHPAAAQSLAEQGASLILYPLNNILPIETAARWRARSVQNLIDRARQTGCWVASADVSGTAGDRISHGCTLIVSPDGDILGRVPEGTTGVVIADIPEVPKRSRSVPESHAPVRLCPRPLPPRSTGADAGAARSPAWRLP